MILRLTRSEEAVCKNQDRAMLFSVRETGPGTADL